MFACVFHYCFTQAKREIINLVIHSLIVRANLEPHNLEVPGSSPGWSTKNLPHKQVFMGHFFIRTSSLWIFEILTRNRLFCFVVDLLLTPK